MAASASFFTSGTPTQIMATSPSGLRHWWGSGLPALSTARPQKRPCFFCFPGLFGCGTRVHGVAHSCSFLKQPVQRPLQPCTNLCTQRGPVPRVTWVLPQVRAWQRNSFVGISRVVGILVVFLFFWVCSVIVFSANSRSCSILLGSIGSEPSWDWRIDIKASTFGWTALDTVVEMAVVDMLSMIDTVFFFGIYMLSNFLTPYISNQIKGVILSKGV